MEEFELEPGETITRSVRQHWIILVYKLIPYVILAIIPFLFPIAFAYFQQLSPVNAAAVSHYIIGYAAWLRLLIGLYLLFIWMGLFTIVTRYYLTTWIITTTRIVDIHQYGFFSRQVSSFLLNRVQDVTTDVDGFFATVFGFGSLDVETAGRDEKFRIYGVSGAAELRDLIMREVAALHADGQLPQTGV